MTAVLDSRRQKFDVRLVAMRGIVESVYSVQRGAARYLPAAEAP